MKARIENWLLVSVPVRLGGLFLFIVTLVPLVGSVRAGGLVFPDALVAHWAFDQMGGSIVADSSTNNLHGTLSGGGWTQGVSACDGALQFAGSPQAVFFPSDGSPAPAKISGLPYGSIVVRFRFAATGSGAVIPVFYMGQRTTDRAEQFTLILEIGHANDPANRKLYFTIINSGFCFDTGVNLLPDTWYQFVGSVGPQGNTGYLNGEELVGRHYNLGSTPAYTNFFSSVPNQDCLTVGCGRFGGDFLYGPVTVSDVQIYNRPLVATEVKQLYGDTMDPALFTIQRPVPTPEGDGLTLAWPSDPNYHYSVLEMDQNMGGWQPITEYENLPATVPTNTVFIPVEQPGSRLFRVQASHN